MKSTSIKVKKIRDDLYVICSENYMWPNPANIYVITDDKGFSMIDLGCGGHGCLERIKGGLNQLDLTLEKLHTVVLSHAHPDHMGAAGMLLNEYTPTVMIHKDDLEQAKEPERLIDTFDIELAQRLYSDKDSPVTDLLRFFDEFGCSMSSGITPNRVLDEGDMVRLGRYSFEVIHTPGHSPGHISLFDRDSEILYGGDLVGSVIAWYTPSSGGVIGYLSSLEKMEERNPTILLPSHGEVIDKPMEKIESVRRRLLAREKKMVEILSNGRLTFSELNRGMFPNEMIQFFPGVGITESHLRKLILDGRARRIGNDIEMI